MEETREELKRQVEEAREFARMLYNRSRVLSCAYCGHSYVTEQASGAEELTEHIKVCGRHPMRALERQIAELEAENERLMDVEGLGDGEMTSVEKAESYRNELNEKCIELARAGIRVDELEQQNENLLSVVAAAVDGELIAAATRLRHEAEERTDQLEKENASLLDGLMAIYQGRKTKEGEYPHAVYCSGNRANPLGYPGCVCLNGQEVVENLKKTNASLRRDIAEPAPDIQEAVLKQYRYHDLYEENKRLKSLMQELIGKVQTMHCDMGGKHGYSLRRDAYKVIEPIRAIVLEMEKPSE